MDKKLVTSLIIIIVAIGIGWYLLSISPQISEVPETPQNEESSTERATLRGMVDSVDTTQVAVDGPYLVRISSDSGEEAVVAVPSMGIQLCEAQANIVDISQLQTGVIIEVSGTIDEAGRVVPCTSSEDYLRIVQ